MKRLFDIFFSFLGLVVLIPLFIIVALIIIFDSRGGVFYKQLRVGMNGKGFSLLKFRSMKINSDKQGLLTISGRDNRITRFGHFIRKYKIDELPQLINVLAGKMSLVGPRPEVRKYVNLYNTEQQKVLSVNDILQQIDNLQLLIITHQYKQLFTQLIVITRNFSDAQLQISTLTKTTDEYMVLLKGKVGNEPTQVQYYQLLRLADAVKFAKFQPAESECLQALQAAKTLVTTIHSFNYQPKANAV